VGLSPSRDGRQASGVNDTGTLRYAGHVGMALAFAELRRAHVALMRQCSRHPAQGSGWLDRRGFWRR